MLPQFGVLDTGNTDRSNAGKSELAGVGSVTVESADDTEDTEETDATDDAGLELSLSWLTACSLSAGRLDDDTLNADVCSDDEIDAFAELSVSISASMSDPKSGVSVTFVCSVAAGCVFCTTFLVMMIFCCCLTGATF